MKLPSLLALAVLGALATVRAADPAPATDFSAFKTADDLWQQVVKVQQKPTGKPGSREEAMAQAREWMTAINATAEAFLKTYPEDPRRWEAKLLVLRTGTQLKQFAGLRPPPADDRPALDEVINAADAPAKARTTASFMRVLTYAGELDKTKPDTFAAFYKAAGDFLAKYGDDPLAEQMRATQMRILGTDPTPQGAELMEKLAAGTDAKTAEAAKKMIAKRTRMSELKSKPLDLTFTSVNNKDVDLALLRGKVVLVDFWASWCGPCMAEMPNVVGVYQKLHPKGFEIVGISLDQDKGKMQEAMKKHGMEWEQYFDGAGWKNKISSGFGIESIPAAWLIDKKGRLRETDLRGEALGQAIVKLLAE